MNTFFLIFVGLPALEIFLMIKIGGKIGALNIIALIFFTAIVGVYFAKVQSIQTLKSGIINLYKNEVPIYEIISGATITLAALLLIVPGFLTDLIGFLLLIPFTRDILLQLTLRNKKVPKTKEDKNTIDGEIVDKERDDL